MPAEFGDGATPAHEDLMTLKIPAANRIAVSLATVTMIAVGLGTAEAQTSTNSPPRQVKRQLDDHGRPNYGPSGPNVSYQQGPNTRIYITKRSWLDAGTEVLPGDRKFTDYAFPSPYGYPTFARENNNRPIDRQPLSPPADLGGYPTRIPLY